MTDLMERCVRLPRAQFEIVSDIVNRYPVGIALAARQGRQPLLRKDGGFFARFPL